MEGYHRSVFLKEVIDYLNIQDEWYLDCTLGDGGHSIEVIKRGGKVLGIDVDPQALNRVEKRFEQLGIDKNKYKLIQGNFRDIKNLIQQTDMAQSKFAGAIFDLGVSSLQLLSPERGFSFGKDGPLDMRMDPTLGVKALDLVNNLSRKELYELFKSLGEEKYSKRVVDSLVVAREVRPFQTTLELAGVIERAIRGRREKIHPATKIFQALRIVVNDELGALKEGLDEVKDLITPSVTRSAAMKSQAIIKKDGSIIVISFHSLEDRIVKFTFRQWETEGFGEILTSKPITPSESEVQENPRSRSAKLRVFKKYDYH